MKNLASTRPTLDVVTRTALVSLITFGWVGLAAAADDKAPPSEKPLEEVLNAKDIAKVVAPDIAEIDKCYYKHGADQKRPSSSMRIELIIHREGQVFKASVSARGIKGKKLEKCVLAIAKTWQFPRRRYFTTAAVPFFYLQTHVEGAGPHETCWSRRGCPEQWQSRKLKRQQALEAQGKGDQGKGDKGKGDKGKGDKGKGNKPAKKQNKKSKEKAK